MAIFIALIFQVLFVFFAMAINVALVVHDKINLQNAVDLAAYYAAERQAEMLNVIAHENYMIRQSWKLLAWRYRVLGSGGLREPTMHPTFSLPPMVADVPFMFGSVGLDPSVCVVHSDSWQRVDPNESLCKRPTVNIPALPRLNVIAGFLPFNFAFARLADRMRDNMERNCDTFGAYNYWFAAAALQAFRVDQYNRKQVIFALANNLNSRNNGDFIDLDGNSVEAGAYKTFSKNLTFSNGQTQANFKIMNSLQGIRRDQWLPEVQVAPTMRYIDPETGASCVGVGKSVTVDPSRPAAVGLLMRPLTLGGLGAADLAAWAKADFIQASDFQYSMGVEKNPWVMAYVGVQAETQPRQIFFPFGNAITMKARAFAKPFGGRIGPWYGSRWARSADKSGGDDTDPLGPPRLAAGGLMNGPNDPRRLPNYSRFPGDKLGLRSALALNGVIGIPGMTPKADFSFYQHVWLPMDVNGYNDPLAYDSFTNFAPPIRQIEIAAIAPDLFDAAYYSIEPNFAINYLVRLRANAVKIGIPSNIPIRGDLGTNTFLKNETFSVQDQMNVAAGITAPGVRQRPEAFYFMRAKSNLLTAWASGEVMYDYSFPSDRFGQCMFPDDAVKPEFKVPGSCMARGGRTGYSVKFVARDALFSTAHPIGGDGEAPGGIINQPPQADGW